MAGERQHNLFHTARYSKVHWRSKETVPRKCSKISFTRQKKEHNSSEIGSMQKLRSRMAAESVPHSKRLQNAIYRKRYAKCNEHHWKWGRRQFVKGVYKRWKNGGPAECTGLLSTDLRSAGKLESALICLLMWPFTQLSFTDWPNSCATRTIFVYS